MRDDYRDIYPEIVKIGMKDELTKAEQDALAEAGTWMWYASGVITRQAVVIQRIREQVDADLAREHEYQANIREAEQKAEKYHLALKAAEEEIWRRQTEYEQTDQGAKIAAKPQYDYTQHFFRCECGRRLKTGHGARPHERYKYCPNCGAKLLWSLTDVAGRPYDFAEAEVKE